MKTFLWVVWALVLGYVYGHPKGWQAVERTAPDGREKLIVAHVFDQTAVEISLPLEGNYRICGRFGDASGYAAVEHGALVLTLADGAYALHLRRA